MTGRPRSSLAAAALVFLLASGTEGLGEENPAEEKETAREVLSRLDRRLGGISSMQGRFVQTFISAGLSVPQSEGGRFYLMRPGRMRWEYTSPEPKTAVSDGTFTWLYLPEEGVVYRGTVEAWKREGPFAILAGGALGEVFEAEGIDAVSASRRGAVVLKMRPKRPAEAFEFLLVEIDPSTLSIFAVTAVDGMGNRIAAAFSDVKVNDRLRADLFTFTPPKGARVIDQDAAAPRRP